VRSQATTTVWHCTAYSSPDVERQIVLAANAGEEGALTTAARDAITHLANVAYC
jgi:hypothetical protein